jgi:hypothetical protein
VIRNAIVGGGVWAALATGAILGFVRLGTIEVLFLLGPLVVVPLGLELSTRLGQREANQLAVRVAPWMQLPAALCVVASFFFPQGAAAAILALPWFCFGCFLGFWGLMSFLRGGFKSLKGVCVPMSFSYLVIGCACLVASRYGLNPMGFQEPIVLLTAVHFHFAGFAASHLTRAAAVALGRTVVHTRTLFRAVAVGVLAGPGVLVAGFVIGPRLKLTAALLLVASEIGLAFFFLAALKAMRPRLAQVFVALSAASVLFAMVFAGIWAIGEFPLQPFVHLAQMAKFHGAANALGFSVCGLLGWTISLRGPAQVKGDAQ